MCRHIACWRVFMCCRTTLRLREENCSAALQVKPSAELHFELGLVEGQLGNLDAAATEFRTAIQLNPRFAPAHSMLGVTVRRQGDHSRALAEFRKAVELDPQDAEAQYNLGMELKAGGRCCWCDCSVPKSHRVEA